MLRSHKPEWMEENTKEAEIWNIVQKYLDEALLDGSTTERLTETTKLSILQHAHAAPSMAVYEDESRSLFAIILGIVKQLDAGSIQQDHLIHLMLSFRKIPLPISVVEELDTRDTRNNMNSDLTKLINVLANFERDAPLHPPLDERYDDRKVRHERQPWRVDPGEFMSGEEWANINAFIARLRTAAPTVPHLDARGMSAMIEAFEVPSSSSELNDVVAAASYWLIYAGSALKNNTVPYPRYPDTGNSRRFPWSHGELWQGERGFCDERWSFWMSRLKEMAGRDDLSDYSRSAAMAAISAESRIAA